MCCVCMCICVCIYIFKFKLKMICEQNERHLDGLTIGFLASELTRLFFYTLQADLLHLPVEGSAPANYLMMPWSHGRKDSYITKLQQVIIKRWSCCN